MSAGRHTHRWIIAGVVLALAVLGVITYGVDQNRDAEAKADELISLFEARGISVPAEKSTITSTLGDDGGPVCDDPAGALRKALFDSQLVNGAAQVGVRPIRAATNVVRGQALILQVYCPEELDAFRQRVEDYKTDDTVKE